jgi:hypothetical protein
MLEERFGVHFTMRKINRAESIGFFHSGHCEDMARLK